MKGTYKEKEFLSSNTENRSYIMLEQAMSERLPDSDITCIRSQNYIFFSTPISNLCTGANFRVINSSFQISQSLFSFEVETEDSASFNQHLSFHTSAYHLQPARHYTQNNQIRIPENLKKACAKQQLSLT